MPRLWDAVDKTSALTALGKGHQRTFYRCQAAQPQFPRICEQDGVLGTSKTNTSSRQRAATRSAGGQCPDYQFQIGASVDSRPTSAQKTNVGWTCQPSSRHSRRIPRHFSRHSHTLLHLWSIMPAFCERLCGTTIHCLRRFYSRQDSSLGWKENHGQGFFVALKLVWSPLAYHHTW